MSRRATVSAAQVERSYNRAKVLLPNVQPLHRDSLTRSWFIGNMQIGATGREAERYLAGMVDGLRVAVFSTMGAP